MLILIAGTYGAGKTLLLTYFASLSHKANRNIVSNYKLPKFNANEFNTNLLFEENLSHVDLYLDEIYSLIDARSSFSSYSKLMSYILFQSRKRDVNIFGTMQLVRSIDVRYRELYDIMIFADAVRDGFEYQFYNKKKSFKIKLTFKMASKIFGLYDTNEIVVSDEMISLKDQFLTPAQEKKMAEESIESFNRFMEEYNVKRVTLNFIKFFCRETKRPLSETFINAMKYTIMKNNRLEGLKTV